MLQTINLPPSKRIFDIAVSILLYLLFLPLILFIIIWIIIEQIFVKESRGSFLYSEKRVSQGKVFNFYKWRIFKMKAIAEALKNGRIIHTTDLQQNPENITYYGKFLKRIYMDELPQLWNVLKGDMTLVGPRPTNLENSENMKKSGDLTREVMVCGITGPFQSQKGHHIQNQLNLDEEYINFVANNPGWKVVLKDVKILLQTIRIVLEAKGI
ncbi:MAG: sugar transferase [Candidatus Magasanikbacteria bacterium]